MLFVTALAVLGLTVTAGPAMAGKAGPNNANAKQCQKNGWQKLYTPDGGTFASETACTSYGAQGGVLQTWYLVVSTELVLIPDENVFIWGAVSGRGLDPGTDVLLHESRSATGDDFLIVGGGTSRPDGSFESTPIGGTCRPGGVVRIYMTGYVNGQVVQSNTATDPCEI